MTPGNEFDFQALLERDLFRLPSQIARAFSGKTILITGGAGSIGSQLLQRVRCFDPANIVVFDNAEDRLYQLHRELQATGAENVELVLGDINAVIELRQVMEKWRPQIVFHAAAHKHVDLLEEQVLAAVRTNVFGTRNVLNLSATGGVECVVVLSSDKATNPISILGATKRVAELLVLASSSARTAVSAVRLCNVLGTRGSLLPLVEEQARSGIVRITDSAAERYFIAPEEGADLLLAAASAREEGVLIPITASRLNIRTLASRIIRQMADIVEFEITGLRPGEKLSEELHSQAEALESSRAVGLTKVVGARALRHEVAVQVQELENAYLAGDEDLVIGKLMNLVPEFHPSMKVGDPVSQ